MWCVAASLLKLARIGTCALSTGSTSPSGGNRDRLPVDDHVEMQWSCRASVPSSGGQPGVATWLSASAGRPHGAVSWPACRGGRASDERRTGRSRGPVSSRLEHEIRPLQADRPIRGPGTGRSRPTSARPCVRDSDRPGRIRSNTSSCRRTLRYGRSRGYGAGSCLGLRTRIEATSSLLLAARSCRSP